MFEDGSLQEVLLPGGRRSSAEPSCCSGPRGPASIPRSSWASGVLVRFRPAAELVRSATRRTFTEFLLEAESVMCAPSVIQTALAGLSRRELLQVAAGLVAGTALGGFKKIIRPLEFCTIPPSQWQEVGTMELSPSMCAWLVETANSFHSAQRRHFMAQPVETLDLRQRETAH